MSLTEVNAEIGLPWGLGKVGGVWRPDTAEKNAAWEMLVELSTRVTIVELHPEDGLLREALTSLHSLFDVTREILRRHGPSVAQPRGEGSISFAFLAVAVLNGGIRPFLSYWHPVLMGYEQSRPADIDNVLWERRWERAAEMRGELASVRELLTTYTGIIAEVCDARNILGGVSFIPPAPPGSHGTRS